MRTILASVLAALLVLGALYVLGSSPIVEEIDPELLHAEPERLTVSIAEREEPQIDPDTLEVYVPVSSIDRGETIGFVATSNIAPKAYYEEDQIPLARNEDSYIGLLGFDTRALPRQGTIEVVAGDLREVISFELIGKEYRVSKIIVPDKLASTGVTTASQVSQSVAKNDNRSLSEVLAPISTTNYITEPFTSPLPTWVDVGEFGVVREDQHGAIRHLGVDLDGAEGDEIMASNRGMVVLAESLPNYGKTVVIDHGLGIYSLYLHLEDIKTIEGQLIERGEVLGTLGNSGLYSLEPHLHFSIKIRGVSVNPKQFIFLSEELYKY